MYTHAYMFSHMNKSCQVYCNQVLARGQHSARRNPHTVHCSKSFLRLIESGNVYMYDKTPFVTLLIFRTEFLV